MNTLSPIYIIANANGYNTVLEVLAGIDQYYPEFKDKFTVEEIRTILNSMYNLIRAGERLYPNISIKGIHTYHVLRDGSVIHNDYVNEWVSESDDSSWVSTSYQIDMDLVPIHFNEIGDDVGEAILAYHNQEINKPIWIIE